MEPLSGNFEPSLDLSRQPAASAPSSEHDNDDHRIADDDAPRLLAQRGARRQRVRRDRRMTRCIGEGSGRLLLFRTQAQIASDQLQPSVVRPLSGIGSPVAGVICRARSRKWSLKEVAGT